MVLDFISGAYKGRSVAIDSQECVNLYPEISESGNAKGKISLIGTPGKRLFVDFGYGTIRAIYSTSDDRCFVVTGNRLYEMFSDRNTAYIGKLKTSSGNVGISENETQLILVDGIAGYLYYLNDGVEPAGTFNEILSGDYQKGTSVVNVNRYFLQNVNDSGYFICSAIGDGNTWDALDAASAEISPDKIATVGTVNNELWVFGTKTVEVWYNSGNVDFPFSRINNASMNIGISAKDSLGIINNSAIWIGGNSQGQGIVWMATGYIPRRISTHGIEYLIGTFGDVSSAKAWVYQQEGHYFYVISFPGAKRTLCYDISTDLWHERGYYNKNTGLNEADIAGCATFFAGNNYVGDYRNGKVYKLDLDYYYDDENLIKRIRTGGHIHKDRKRIFFNQFEIDLERGIGLSTGPEEVTTTAPKIPVDCTLKIYTVTNYTAAQKVQILSAIETYFSSNNGETITAEGWVGAVTAAMGSDFTTQLVYVIQSIDGTIRSYGLDTGEFPLYTYTSYIPDFSFESGKKGVFDVLNSSVTHYS